MLRFTDSSGVTRLEGSLSTTGGATGDVLTVQADGSVIPAAGGGSRPSVLGPFPFAFNTPGLAAGIVIYTPAANEFLFDAWIEVTTAFDGTTPLADIGDFAAGPTFGFFFNFDSAAIDLTNATTDIGDGNTGLVPMNSQNSLSGALIAGAAGGSGTWLPFRFPGSLPIKLAVSQDGRPGGTPIDSTVGAANLYLRTGVAALP